MGVGGCLEALERTRSGSFFLKDSLSMEELKKRIEEGNLSGLLLSSGTLLGEMPALSLDDESLAGFRQGRAVAAPGAGAGLFRVLNARGRLAGIGAVDGSDPETLKPQKVFGPEGID